jgi:hypothetical protein
MLTIVPRASKAQPPAGAGHRFDYSDATLSTVAQPAAPERPLDIRVDRAGTLALIRLAVN